LLLLRLKGIATTVMYAAGCRLIAKQVPPPCGFPSVLTPIS
jgi:hypothetical protein